MFPLVFKHLSERTCIIMFTCTILLLHSGCKTGHTTKGIDNTHPWKPVDIRFADGFRLDTGNRLIRLDVLNPWQGKEKIRLHYIIGETGGKDTPGKQDRIRIRKKVQRVICTSTTHIAFLEQLGKLNSIVAISGKTLIGNTYIRQKINAGDITDIGYDKNINYEEIVRLHPDLVFLYGIGPEVTGITGRLSSLGIPSVIVGDYLEKSPLGRAEWIKFFAAFFGREEKAVHWFDSLAIRYEQAKYHADTEDSKPLVMAGLPWKEVWYVSGGTSMLATFINDAGGTYVWNDMNTSEAIPMDIERVFRKAGNADIWINCGEVSSINGILGMDKRLGLFGPVKMNRVYNNNARLNEYGGNDYWESGVIHPDLIVKDMKSIFHPELMPGYHPVYYKQLRK